MITWWFVPVGYGPSCKWIKPTYPSTRDITYLVSGMSQGKKVTKRYGTVGSSEKYEGNIIGKPSWKHFSLVLRFSGVLDLKMGCLSNNKKGFQGVYRDS